MRLLLLVVLPLAMADAMGTEPKKCGSAMRWVMAFLVGGVCSRGWDVLKGGRAPAPAPKARPARRRVRLETVADCEDDCSICLEPCASFGAVGRLPVCGHAFHRSCIERWLERGATSCPVCRTENGCDHHGCDHPKAA